MHVQSTLVFKSFVALKADKGLTITTIINISLKWFQNTLGDEVRGSHLMSCWSLAPLFNISCWSLASFLNASGWSLATLLSVTGWWLDDWSRTSEIIALESLVDLVNWPYSKTCLQSGFYSYTNTICVIIIARTEIRDRGFPLLFTKQPQGIFILQVTIDSDIKRLAFLCS